jgi:hypothetical protein
MSTGQLPPVAVCTKCGKYSRRVEAINQQCGERYDRKRCKGVYGSALSSTDWAPCKHCGGTGQRSEGPCEACQRSGFIYVRALTAPTGGRPTR